MNLNWTDYAGQEESLVIPLRRDDELEIIHYPLTGQWRLFDLSAEHDLAEETGTGGRPAALKAAAEFVKNIGNEYHYLAGDLENAANE